MNPDLEVVAIGSAESFKAWEHGYPYRTVRWHFHPEYEIHHVVATTGQYFVGDFIGEFEPGNLVLTGPNLPHNWVSDVPPGTCLPLRCRVLQFSESFFADANRVFPELSGCIDILEMSRRGVLFTPETAALVGPILGELVEAKGIRRIELFMNVLNALSSAENACTLSSTRYHPDPSGFMSAGVNQALAYINTHLTEPFSEADLAELTGQSPSAFSRSFRRHTGMALVQYVNRLRINFACHLLMSKAELSITDICFAAGFNNISNFNRRFLDQKGMAPSRFRTLLAQNVRAVEAA
ncbi:AraC family transcriptional regulator [Rhizobium leucaenae]|uniref:AraC-like DNA-binding protein n=1 Tax=Rhizobium leucaenae TaxID=29450 RepID=A0A7W6ZS12_9HYPH|nr:AraC family transcriptional regulator [Rhizobium leucaenae]MBB4567238.1 AraC-like DNA-binding protein [Rhizobium leucaenae]MBB6304283.1 AraC-like DNA-binding protein [Rhizobium leucaenae]